MENSSPRTILKREKIYISKKSSGKENIGGEIKKFNHSTNENEEVHFVKIVKCNGQTVKIWECGVCSREFQHNYTLIRHLPIHSDVRNFQCKDCGKSFRQFSTLTQHKSIHSTDRPFVCDLCDRSFNRISTLISHKKIHSEEKPYKCQYCDKSFHQKGNLKNHLFIHTNARPYLCDLCNRGFNQMSNLVCHKKKFHQKDDDSTVWTCLTCSMTFKKLGALRSHEMKEHKENQPEIISFLIPEIRTEALLQTKANMEIPFALLHLIDGKILIVRIIDSGTSSFIKEASKDDFQLLQKTENSKITLPMVADIHQQLNSVGGLEYVVRPPDTSFKFLNEQPIEPIEIDEEEEMIQQNVKIEPPADLPVESIEYVQPIEPIVVDIDQEKIIASEPVELPETGFMYLNDEPESEPIVVVDEEDEVILGSDPVELPGNELMNQIQEPVVEPPLNEDFSFLDYNEYMDLINAIYSGGYEPNFEGINNFFAENNISLNF